MSVQTLRLVHKTRYDEQVFVTIPAQKGPLAPSSVRVKTLLVGLSSNNLSYCLNGTLLHWWSCFPLPQSTPGPYDDDSQFGVAPGWGYAVVQQSSLEGVEEGRIIYGFLPISFHSVDLQLRKAESMPDDWTEDSPHRSKLMNLYQRYSVMPKLFDPLSTFAAWTAVLKTWESGSCLARFVFPQDHSTPIHPFGVPVSPWGEEEADLSGACVVCIASGTKTARSFIYQLAKIAAENEPQFSLVEVTSDSQGCARYLKTIPFAHKVVGYDASSGAFSSYPKFVLLDFGGRDNALRKVFDSIRRSSPSAKVLCVSIGGESKVYDEQAAKEKRTVAAELKSVQMNASGIRDRAKERMGEPLYFKQLADGFETMVREQTESFDGKVLGTRLKIAEGMRGEEGVEGIWNRLCKGQISGDEGVAVRLE